MATTSQTLTTIEEGPEGLRIVMPVPRVGCAMAFLAVWLLGWLAGEVSAIGALISGGMFGVGAAFLLFWLAGWTAGGVFAGSALAMMLDGSEIVTVGQGTLRRRLEAFGLGLSWRYPLETCGNLRPTGDSSGIKSFISFDVAGAKGDKTIRFGTGLTEPRADEIAEKIWALYPALMPDHERRKRSVTG